MTDERKPTSRSVVIGGSVVGSIISTGSDERRVWVVTHNLTPEINNVITGVFSSLEKAERFIGEMGTSRANFRVNSWKVDADAD